MTVPGSSTAPADVQAPETGPEGFSLSWALGSRLRALRKAVVVTFWVNTILASRFMPWRPRVFFLRAWGMKLGEGTMVRPGCNFGSKLLEAGSGCKIDRIDYDGDAPLILEDNVFIGRGSQVITRTHPLGGPDRRRGPGEIDKAVRIGKGCWVPNSATIMPGVTIAPGCVVLAGAIVSRSTEPNGLYGGQPARRIKDLPA